MAPSAWPPALSLLLKRRLRDDDGRPDWAPEESERDQAEEYGDPHDNPPNGPRQALQVRGERESDEAEPDGRQRVLEDHEEPVLHDGLVLGGTVRWIEHFPTALLPERELARLQHVVLHGVGAFGDESHDGCPVVVVVLDLASEDCAGSVEVAIK